ncbi:uncharacterized protein [Typha latifolia]|uniref:uncharacterized protein n=1 Tax=Typha latifolia TaxID=4733 RepID=UPI003C303D9A
MESSQNSNNLSGEISQQPNSILQTSEEFIGYLDVFVHQAREIHNICIYHKQDVYAKLCLTNDPDGAISTKTINGGGRSPVFNESLRLNVRNFDSSLKCELWMLSRVKNYLEDQLLGFALVPLADIVVGKGKLAQEFSLSSTDLFHSPAGFVQLSLSYVGSSPEVIPVSPTAKTLVPTAPVPDSENDDSIPCEYEKIEFPDLQVVNENHLMVSEYFGIPCSNMDAQSSESLIAMENGNHPIDGDDNDNDDDDAGVRVVESFSNDKSIDPVRVLRNDTPSSSVTTTDSSSAHPATSQSASDPSVGTASPRGKDKSPEVTEGEAESSVLSEDAIIKPIISIDIEPKESVVQQDIVDMYMKSMQQSIESLAKMKLPMDIENSSTTTENANMTSDKKPPPSKETGARVFYGSRAFF